MLRRYCFALLAVLGLLTACGRATPSVPEGDIEFGQGPVSLQVRDQAVREGAVIIDRVEIDRDGWVVVHVSENGGPGLVLGQTKLQAGRYENVRVEIDVSRATASLLVLLYEDTGQIGTFEFPQADPPVLSAAGPAMEAFTVDLP